MKKLFILIFVLSLPVIILFQSCKSDNNNPTKEINKYNINSLDSLVLKSLSEKRVVMIGDNYHGHGYYYNLVISSLNHWLDKVSDNASDEDFPHKLFLFLEYDSTFENAFNDIIENGNIEKFLSHSYEGILIAGGFEQASIDRLKFFYELRNIQNRIKKINLSDKSKNIELRIKRIESEPPCNLEKMAEIGMDSVLLKKCRDENWEWFVNERDLLSSNKAIEILENNTTYKALIFYGTAHLSRIKTDKRNFGDKLDEPAFGYYLAYYLDKEFGRDEVEVYNSINTFNQPGGFIYEYDVDSLYDYILNNKIIPELLFPLLLIKNKLTLKSLMDLMELYKEKGYYAFRYFAYNIVGELKRSYLYYDPVFKKKIDGLKIYVDELLHDNFKHYKETVSIAKDLLSSFDAVQNITQIDKWIIPAKYSHLYYSFLRSLIYNLPKDTTEGVFYNELWSSYKRNTLSNFEKNLLKKRIEEIKVYVLINFLWIADSDERVRTVEYLRKITGENFSSKEEWDNWWMEKYKPSEKMFWN